MRKLDTSSITPTIGMPIKSGTIQHLQLAYQEALSALAYNAIGSRTDSTYYYILYGCVNLGSGLNYNITAGAVLYNGEVFLVDAVTFTAATGQVAVGSFTTTYFSAANADPVLFSDSVSRNILQIRKLVFAAGTSGSGAVDFTAMKVTSHGFANQTLATLGTTYSVTFEQSKSVFVSSAPNSTTFSFDLTYAIPGNVHRIKWTYGAGLTITISAGTSQTVIKDSGNLAAVASANNVLYFMYMGKNEAGNDEIVYNLKQF